MKRYSDEDKLLLVKNIDDLVKNGIKFKKACQELHTDTRTIIKFREELMISQSNQSDMNVSKRNQNDIIVTTNKDLPFQECTIDNSKDKKKKRKIRFMASLSEDRLKQLKSLAFDKGIPYATLASLYIVKGIDEESIRLQKDI